MSEDADNESESVRTMCYGCGGSGKVSKPRLFVSLQTGEADTVIELGRCPYCKDSPGSLPGIVPPV